VSPEPGTGDAQEHLAVPAGRLRRSTLEGFARVTVGGTVSDDTRARCRELGLLDGAGQPVAELVPLGTTVADPIADVALLRASAGDLAEVHGWWRPELCVLHTDARDPATSAPYVLVGARTLPQAVLQALAVPDRGAAPGPILLDGVDDVLDVARRDGAGWAGSTGAEEPEQVVLHRWDIATPDRAAAVVRAIVSAPDGLRVLRHDDHGPQLVPTDLVAEELELASVTELLLRVSSG
jgi:hypothetical protein